MAVFDPYANLENLDEYKFIAQHQQKLHNLQQQAVLPHSDDIAHWLRPIEQLIYDSHIWASVLNHYPVQKRSSAAGHGAVFAAPSTTAAAVQRQRMSVQL